MRMLTLPVGSRRRRPTVSGGRARLPIASHLLTTLALAATASLAAAPVASAQSTAESDGTIAVSSLGATNNIPGSVAGSLGSVAQPAYAGYVALGDSYAALGDNRQPTGEPAACGRNLSNYPHLLDASPAVGDLTDATCGGAQIPDLTGSQTVGTPPNTASAPPQFDALDSDTNLVTLSIGGNDVGFGTIVACITRQGPFEELPATQTCESQVGDKVSADISSLYGADGPIDGVYDAIAEASPNARVIATQYMPLLPSSGGCAFTDAVMTPEDVDWARGITEDINTAVDAAATRNGHVSVMPTDDVDRSACAPADQRWTSFLGAPDNTAGMHPTALGQQAMADAIAAAL